MSEFGHDDLVGAVLAGVRREVSGHIRPRGAAAVMRTVRRRRKQRAIAGGILVAALIVAPLTGLALAQGTPSPAPTVGTEATTPAVSDPPPSAGSTPSAGSSPTADDPGIPASELRNATLPIAAWPTDKATPQCQSGQVKFTDGKASGDYLSLVGEPRQVDIDRDGGKESVVRVYCRVAQTGYTRVVVFDRAARGGIRNVGTVLTTQWGAFDGKEVATVWDVQVTDDGHIRVDVGDYELCCGADPTLPQHQWRAYGWNGSTFVQTDGPTTFPPNPRLVDLSPHTGEIVMLKLSEGRWGGVVQVEVRNAGPATAQHPVLWMRLPVDAAIAKSVSVTCDVSSGAVQCPLAALAAGASIRIDLIVETGVNPAGQAEIRVYDDVSRDGKEDDNTLKVTVNAL